MNRAAELETVLERLLKALDNYQRHGDMLTDRYKRALSDAKIEAVMTLAKGKENDK